MTLPVQGGSPLRHIWLCADDYGISPSVSRGIRELVEQGRLNATSVMVVAPSFGPAEAAALSALNDKTWRVAVGLHLTLTAPFRPLTAGYAPTRDGTFLPLGEMLLRGLLHLLRPEALKVEVTAQLKAFVAAFGRPPDFVDGHQHVHLFPQVRDAVLSAVREIAPDAWVRQCGSAVPLHRRLHDRKAILLDALSSTFRRKAKALGVATNPAFAGTYDFAAQSEPDYAARFPAFLDNLPSGSVVMCHPGFVDAELERLDPLTTMREREYAFFASDQFLRVLSSAGVALANKNSP
jgi:hypothetical protein